MGGLSPEVQCRGHAHAQTRLTSLVVAEAEARTCEACARTWVLSTCCVCPADPAPRPCSYEAALGQAVPCEARARARALLHTCAGDARVRCGRAGPQPVVGGAWCSEGQQRGLRRRGRSGHLCVACAVPVQEQRPQNQAQQACPSRLLFRRQHSALGWRGRHALHPGPEREAC